jgi:hypothetical protein
MLLLLLLQLQLPKYGSQHRSCQLWATAPCKTCAMQSTLAVPTNCFTLGRASVAVVIVIVIKAAIIVVIAIVFIWLCTCKHDAEQGSVQLYKVGCASV